MRARTIPTCTIHLFCTRTRVQSAYTALRFAFRRLKSKPGPGGATGPKKPCRSDTRKSVFGLSVSSYEESPVSLFPRILPRFSWLFLCTRSPHRSLPVINPLTIREFEFKHHTCCTHCPTNVQRTTDLLADRGKRFSMSFIIFASRTEEPDDSSVQRVSRYLLQAIFVCLYMCLCCNRFCNTHRTKSHSPSPTDTRFSTPVTAELLQLLFVDADIWISGGI